MNDNDLIRRGDALNALSRSAWRHSGDDRYSAGMDVGARKQSEADSAAIAALPAVRPDPLADPRLAALVYAAKRASHATTNDGITDPIYTDEAVALQRALAAFGDRK